MKKLISLLLSAVLIISALFSANAVIDFSGKEDGLFNTYTSAQILEMYPEAAQHLKKELESLNSDISMKNYNVPENNIEELYVSVLYENPEIFYVNPLLLDVSSDSNGTLISVRPTYFFNSRELPAEKEKFENNAQFFLKGVDDSWSTVLKCRYLHDILAQYCEYDTDETSTDYKVYTAYGAMVGQVAVCQGYTLAYNYLLGKLGIEAKLIQSTTMDHSWSVVNIDGSYYHVDITRDDPSDDTLGRVYHNYCIASDMQISYDGSHSDWVSNYPNNNPKYNGVWWRDVETVIYPIDGKDYYIDHLYKASEYGGLIAHDISTDNEEEIARIDTRWYVTGDSERFWRGNYSYLFYDGYFLYYNDTSNIYKILPDGSNKSIFYKKPNSISCNIYGIAPKMDGKLYMSAKDNPNAADVIYKVDENIFVDPSSSSSSSTVTSPIDGYELGDVNMDKVVDIRDATLIQKSLVDMATLNETQKALADMNNNNSVNISDATNIQRLICGKSMLY